MELLARKDAIAKGLNLYFTGEKCKNGHIAQRYTATCACRECLNGYRRVSAQKVVSALAGTPIFSMKVHADDHAAVTAYIQALYMQRGMTPPPAPDAPPASRPQPTRWQLWSRTYGSENALRMIRDQPPHSPEELALLAQSEPVATTLPRPGLTTVLPTPYVPNEAHAYSTPPINT